MSDYLDHFDSDHIMSLREYAEEKVSSNLGGIFSY
jgi:hypothetical protein